MDDSREVHSHEALTVASDHLQVGNVLPEWLKRDPHQVHVLPESQYLYDREKLQPAGKLKCGISSENWRGHVAMCHSRVVLSPHT